MVTCDWCHEQFGSPEENHHDRCVREAMAEFGFTTITEWRDWTRDAIKVMGTTAAVIRKAAATMGFPPGEPTPYQRKMDALKGKDPGPLPYGY